MWNTSPLPNTSLQPTGESGRSFGLAAVVAHSYLVSAVLAPAAELHRSAVSILLNGASEHKD
jgi:hypothetical protein